MDSAFTVSPALLGLVGFFVVLLVALAVFGKVPISYNIRNLFVRWPITLLVALAFIMVVGLMTVMLAFVNGMYRLTANSGVPGNVMVMADGATDELFSNLPSNQETRKLEKFLTGNTALTEEGERLSIAQNEEGKQLVSYETYIVVNQPIPHSEHSARKRRFLQVRGVEDPVRSGQVHNMPLFPGGQWFSDAGVQDVAGEAEKAIQCVLGHGIARELGKDFAKPSLEVNDLFEVADRKWIVTGIMQSDGSMFDSEIWAKQSHAGKKFGKENFTTVVLRTPTVEMAEKTAKKLTKEFKATAVQARTEEAYFESLNATNAQFLFAIIFVAVIMAIGGVFGVMNTMFAAISQRTRDIGVMRILGFKRWQILVSFFLEALVLAFLGGLIGCAIGSLANGWTASSIMSAGQGGGKSVVLKLVVDANILLSGMLFSLLMGCVGGLLPALSAMRLKPLDSVR
jgi:ABC-type antimicrobial peptide transport system permease subunit